jgi:hypothetical protein
MHIRRAEEEKAKKKERNVRYNTLVICRGLTVSHPLYLVRFVFASLAVTGTVKWSVHAMNFATLHVRQVNPTIMHNTEVICPV